MGHNKDILHLLDISTGHIKQSTRDWLDDTAEIQTETDERGHSHTWIHAGGDQIIAKPYEHGWVIFAHEPATLYNDVPDDIKELMLFAFKRRVDWVQVDRDGPRLCGLTWYEEEDQENDVPEEPPFD